MRSLCIIVFSLQGKRPMNISQFVSTPVVSRKQTDPRYQWFRTHFGELAWELDALDPNVLRVRVEENIRTYINWERRNE
jgi:hypothetical protein